MFATISANNKSYQDSGRFIGDAFIQPQGIQWSMYKVLNTLIFATSAHFTPTTPLAFINLLKCKILSCILMVHKPSSVVSSYTFWGVVPTTPPA